MSKSKKNSKKSSTNKKKNGKSKKSPTPVLRIRRMASVGNLSVGRALNSAQAGAPVAAELSGGEHIVTRAQQRYICIGVGSMMSYNGSIRDDIVHRNGLSYIPVPHGGGLLPISSFEESVYNSQRAMEAVPAYSFGMGDRGLTDVSGKYHTFAELQQMTLTEWEKLRSDIRARDQARESAARIGSMHNPNLAASPNAFMQSDSYSHIPVATGAPLTPYSEVVRLNAEEERKREEKRIEACIKLREEEEKRREEEHMNSLSYRLTKWMR